MGIPATDETKQARRAAHVVLDEYREHFRLSKNKTYRELCRLMKMSREDGHIGRFNLEQCNLLIGILRAEMQQKRKPT